MKKELQEFLKYSSLNVLGMIGLSCYILADTFFISLALGADGLTALNLAIPVYSLVHGCGLMLGMGGATRYSIHRSRGEHGEANRDFTHALLLAAILAAVFLLAGLLGSGPLAAALGADSSVFEMTETYLRVILLFAPAFLLNELLLCFVRNDGQPRLAMLAMLGGSFSNIILDYVFLFPLDLGIFGAVLATGIAPLVSMAILSPYFLKKQNRFRPVRPGRLAPTAPRILSTGLPSLIAELSSGAVILSFNGIILGLQGNTGVAAYGIIANLSLVVIAVFTGIAQGMQPILSRCHGSGDTSAASRILSYGRRAGLLASAALYLVLFLFADSIAGAFNSENNGALQAMAVPGIRIYFTGIFFAGFTIVEAAAFAACERVFPAQILSLLRGVLLILPLAFLLSRLFQMTGVWLAFPAAELLTACAALLFRCRERNRNHGTREKA